MKRRVREAEERAEHVRLTYERRLRELSKDSLETMDAYVLLGVSPTASYDEVKRARLRLVTIYHPDMSRNPDSARIFETIQKAYEKIMKDHPEWR